MKMNIEALKALELKLAEYSKENGAIAEHESKIDDYGCTACNSNCQWRCDGSCKNTCSGGCSGGRSGRHW